MKTTAIILSGGKGLRFGTDIPKQYIEISGRPILAYTLEAFQKSIVDEIIIVAADEYIDTCRDIAEKCGASKVTAVIPGGSERYYSVLNGLEYIGKERNAAKRETADGEADDRDIVLIQDGARPFIRPDVIGRIIEEVRSSGAAIAASPCTDTIKLIDEDGNITGTTERKLTWAAQTPQAFYFDEIYNAYKTVFGEQPGNTAFSLQGITDDAMVFQQVYPDRNVKVVDAGAENIKITTYRDLYIAERFITKQ